MFENLKTVAQRTVCAILKRHNVRTDGQALILTCRRLRARTRVGIAGCMNAFYESRGLVSRILYQRIGRFTTTDPVIADIWNGQSLNRYAYVLNNPLAFVDPTGFVPEDLDEPSGSWRTTLEPPIFNGPEPDSYTYGVELNRRKDSKQEAPKTGAHAPPVDMSTTGNGGDGLPQETTPP